MTDDLARRIREHRERLFVSQKELADYLGVSVQAVQKWEYGLNNPRSYHRRKLERFLQSEEIEFEESA